jgi:hypothetical protein
MNAIFISKNKYVRLRETQDLEICNYELDTNPQVLQNL